MKSKIKKYFTSFIKSDGINIALALIFIFICWIFLKVSPVIEWVFFTSLVIMALIGFVAKILGGYILNKCEDNVKLTTDYKSLCKKYIKLNLLKYDNSTAQDGKNEVFPIDVGFIFSNPKIKIVDDPSKKYHLPDIVKENYKDLLDANATSNAYNQLNIRVDDWVRNDKEFVLYTSRTTFYDSLVTNRTTDYEWSNGMTNRELFLYGPFFPSLKESVFSDHLGYNGFVISRDGWIPFVKRGADVSIGKRTYGNSIGASMKAKYALESAEDYLMPEGIYRAIKADVNVNEFFYQMTF